MLSSRSSRVRAVSNVPLEDFLDQAGLAGAVAVVERERREVDGRVREAVERLRARRHDLRVREMLRVERDQLVVRRCSLRRQPSGCRLAAHPLRMSTGTVPGMFEWMPSSPAGAWMPRFCVTAAPQSPPCATYSS